MNPVYEIGIAITLANGVSAGLSAIAKQLIETDKLAKGLRGSLMGIGTISLGVGMGIADGLFKAVDHAKELSHQLVQIKNMGISDQQYEEAKKAGMNMPYSVKGATSVQALEVYGEAYSMFGHEETLKILEPLTKFAMAIGNKSGDFEGAVHGLRDMMRAGDLMGKFIDEKTGKQDVGALMHFLDLGQKVYTATDGMVDQKTWLNMAQQGAPAMKQMTDDGMIHMAIAAQAMGGYRAGTALTSLFQQVIGGKMTEGVAKNLKDLGLVGDFHHASKGGGLVFEKGALDTEFTRAVVKDPLVAFGVMKDAIMKKLKTDDPAAIGNRMAEIAAETDAEFKAMGRQTTQRLANDFLTNWNQIMAEGIRMSKGFGVDESKKNQDENDYEQVERNFESAKKDALDKLGLPLMKMMIPIMNSMSSIFDTIGKFAMTNPGTIEAIGHALLALSIGLTALGTIAIGAALASAATPLGLVVAGLIALGTWAASAGGPTGEAIKKVGGFLTDMGKSIASWFSGGTLFDKDNGDGTQTSGALTNMASAIGKLAGPDVGRAVESVGKFSAAMAQMAGSAIEQGGKEGGWIDNLYKLSMKGSNAFVGAVKGAGSAVEWVGDKAMQGEMAILPGIKGLLSGLWDLASAATKAVADLVSALAGGIASIATSVGPAISALGSALGGMLATMFNALGANVAKFGAAANAKIDGMTAPPPAPATGKQAMTGHVTLNNKVVGVVSAMLADQAGNPASAGRQDSFGNYRSPAFQQG